MERQEVELTDLIVFVLGAATGALMYWLISREKLARADSATIELKAARTELMTARGLNTRLEAELRAEREKADEKMKVLQGARGELANQFKELSSEALAQILDHFQKIALGELEKKQIESRGELDGRKAKFEELVRPIGESLGKVDKRLGAIEEERKGDHGRLSQQITTMTREHEKLRKEANNLTSALKAPVTRGAWGQLHLERACELAGMVEHCDFTQQVSHDSDDGRLRPDVVVHMPGGKNIVVDAKTPLEHFLRSVETDDENERATSLSALKDAVNNHLKELSKKSYYEQFDQSPDFVVMFIPIEAMYAAALEQDPQLLDKGFTERILIATPTSLLGVLRAIYLGWRREELAENAAEISKVGSDLYNRLVTFAEHFEQVGKQLTRAVDKYNEASRSYDSRLIPGAKRLTSLGVHTKKELPDIRQIDRAPVGIAGATDDIKQQEPRDEQ